MPCGIKKQQRMEEPSIKILKEHNLKLKSNLAHEKCYLPEYV
jgi:hypothetical protein